MPNQIPAGTAQDSHINTDISGSNSVAESNAPASPMNWEKVCLNVIGGCGITALVTSGVALCAPDLASPCSRLAIAAGAIGYTTVFLATLIVSPPEPSLSSLHQLDMTAGQVIESDPDFAVADIILGDSQDGLLAMEGLPEARLLPTAVALPMYQS